jgi:PAS domain S-box-containing protein
MGKPTFDRWLLGAGGLIILLVVAVVLTFQNTRRLNEDARWVAHTHEVLDTLGEATGHLRDAESIQRTYLIEGGDTIPPNFAASIDAARQKVGTLKVLTEDNKEQRDRIPDIESGIEELAGFWTGTMTLRKQQGFDAAKKVVEAGQSRKMMAGLQGRLRQMDDTERGLLRDRSEKREQTYRSALATGLLSGVAAVTGVVAFMVLLRRHLVARTAAAAVIAEQGERLRTTLASIGDAVITTDAEGRVTGMNPVAESLTGWRLAEATGQPLDVVFRIVSEETRRTAQNPATRALNEGIIGGLADHAILIAKDGTERPIDDSAAPIRCKEGQVVGCVLVFRDISERRRLERDNASRLRAARLLAAIVESSEDAIISKSLDGIIQSWNAAAERLFGFTADQAVGRHISLLIPADRIAEEDRIIATLKAGQRIEHYDTVRLRSDGQPIWVSLTISPIKDEAGRVIGASKIVRDITDKRQAEERERLLLAEAAAANAKFRAFFEQGPLYAGVMALDGTLLEANRLSLEACGYTKEQVIGKKFWESAWWSPSSELTETIRAGSAKAAAGELFRAELPYYVADGRERMVDFILLPIKDEAGRVLFLAPTGTDITDRQRAEQELRSAQERLRQSEARFRTFAENGPQMVWSADANGVSQYLNPRWCEYTGLTPEQTADPEQLRRVIHADDYQRMMARWAEAHATGTPYEVEFRIRRAADGAYRWFLCRSVPVRDDRGRIVQWVGANADIDDQKRAEDALVEADRRKDEFLATLAHELRNPLAPIRNALQVIRLSPDREAQAQAQAMMQRQLAQMVRLVDDLLDVSRISRGKLELRREQVALEAVVSSAVETSRPLIDHLGHELTVTLPQQPIIVDADPTRLAQVFSNLLNNSAKYMDRGGHIWLTVERQGGDVAVSVKDTGIGIAADQLPRLFQMFSQVGHSLEKSQGGLGIGLTLVKRLVEMHGGRIEARSEGLGKGAEFVVRLPVVVGASEPQAPAVRNEPPTLKSSLRILIVDDNRDSADSLGMLLQIMGNDIRMAHDGQEGLDVAEEFRPDVVLLDIGLPKLNGYEACRRIREQSWGRSVVLIALTGWGQEDDRRRSHEAGFDHHMVKPVDPQDLMGLLAELNGAKV